MATALSNVVGGSTYIGSSLREDLASFITQLSPEKTPFLSTIGSNKATSPRHDWETDTLDAPGQPALPETFEFAAANASVDNPIRLSNYTEVYGKTISVSGSLNRSDFVTPQNYFSYQRIKRGKEMMRDIEWRALVCAESRDSSTALPAIVNYIPVPTSVDYGGGASVKNRTAGSMAAYARNWWNSALDLDAPATPVSVPLHLYNGNLTPGTPELIQSNTGLNTARTQGIHTFAYANKLVAAADGTNPARDYRQDFATIGADAINGLAGLFSANNGMMSVAQVPTALKASVSKALIAGNGGAAERRASELAKKVNMAVDAVITDFGFDVTIVPNYIMNDTTEGGHHSVFFYDPKAIKRSVLQPMDTVKDMQARYGEAYIMFCEETFEVSDPNSLGFIVGVK